MPGALVVDIFGGVAPRKSPEILTLQGQVALNCRLLSGKLQAWQAPLNVSACPADTQSIYRSNIPTGAQWLNWNTPVSAATSVIPGDLFGRLFFTGAGIPSMTDYGLAAFGSTNLLTTDFTDHQGLHTWAPSTTTLASLGLSVGESITFRVQAFSEDSNQVYGQVIFYNSSAVEISSVNGNAISAGSNYAYSILTATIPAGTVAIAVLTACTGNATNIHSRIGYLTAGVPSSIPAASLPLGVPAPATALTATATSGVGGTGTGTVTQLAQSLFNVTDSTVVETPTTGAGNFTVTAEQTVTFPFNYTGSITGSYTCQMSKANASSGQSIAGNVTAILYVDGVNVWSQTDVYNGSASGSSYTYNYSYPGDSELAGSHDYKLVVTTPTSGNLLVNSATAQFGVQIENQTVISVTNGSTLVVGDAVTLAGVNSALNGQQTIMATAANGSDTWLQFNLLGTNASAQNLTGTWNQSWLPVNQEDTSYVTTFLLDFDGQMLESAPSPASTLVARGQTQPCVLTNIPALPTLPQGVAIAGMNLYRTVAGSNADAFQFVTTYNETTTPTLAQFLASGDTDVQTDAELGETLPTLGWIAPPTDLQGLVAMPGGFLAGFVANTVWLSVPYQPQAWPVAQSYSVDSNIVGIVPIGQSLAVLTEGKPYILTGVDPAQMSMQRIELASACLSAGSVVDMGYAALYACDDGIAMISTKGPELISQALWTKDEFQLLNPSSFVAGRWHNSYVCFYDANGTKGGFIFDPQEAEATLTFTDTYASACWTDPDTGELFCVVNNEIVQWDAGTTSMTYTWQSRDEVAPAPINLAVGRVRASSYPVTFTLFADGVQKDVITVQNDDVFRLAGGYRYRRYSFQLQGSAEVLSAGVATSTNELTQASLESKEFSKQMKRMLEAYKVYE